MPHAQLNHGYFLWVERIAGADYKTWIVGPAAAEGGTFPLRRTIVKETPMARRHETIVDAKDFLTYRVRSEYLGYLNPRDEPVWSDVE